MRTLVVSQPLVDILDGAFLRTDILSRFGNTGPRLVIAILTEALLRGRHLADQFYSH